MEKGKRRGCERCFLCQLDLGGQTLSLGLGWLGKAYIEGGFRLARFECL